MDYLPLIIGLVIAIIVGAKSSSKKKQQGETTPHGENFPFPKEFAEMFGMDETQLEPEPQPRYQTIDQPTGGAEDSFAGEEGVSMTVAQYKAQNTKQNTTHVAIELDQTIEIDRSTGGATGEKFEFDLRKAIIYNEILKPKYNDNLL